MSQSTSSTRKPSYARVTARLAAVIVLPSPGAALVTTSVRSVSPPSDQIRPVRRFRKASMPMEKVWLPPIGEPTVCSAVFFPEPKSRRKWDCADGRLTDGGQPDLLHR